MFKAKNTAFFLVVMLVVGGVVGYAASYLSLRPVLSSQEARIVQLTYAVSVLNATVGDLQGYVSLSNSTIQMMRETIEGLEAFSTVKPGYVRSNLYSLSIQYPQQINVTVAGLLHPDANAESGRMSGRGAGYETFEATWFKAASQPSLEESLEAGMGPLKKYDVELGEKVQATVQGHQALYQTYRITGQGGVFHGAMIVWYCDRSQLFVVFSVTTGSQYIVAIMNDYTAGLYCHVP
jgi:uncharacterized membrane protein